MYDSNITAEELVSSVAASVNIGSDLPADFYIDSLSRLEQLLYVQHIKEERLIVCHPTDGEVDLSSVILPEGERPPRVDDIFAVYSGERPLRRIRMSEAYLFDRVSEGGYYYKVEEDRLAVVLGDLTDTEELAVFYYAAPRLKLPDHREDSLRLPYEFLPMVEAKLRGDAYKLADDDSSASKWLTEYNSQLESFLGWLEGKEDRR